MLAQDSQSFKSWNFDKIRGYLLLKNSGYNSMIYLLRDKLGILNVEQHERNEIIVKQAIVNEVTNRESDIDRFAASLRLPPLFVEKSITWDNITERELDELCLPVYTSSVAPLPTGFYIKVSTSTSFETVKASFKSIQMEMQRSYKDSQQRPIKITKRDTTSRDLENKILCYIIIEEYLYRQEPPEKKVFLIQDNIVTNAILSASEDDRLKLILSSKGEENDSFLLNAYRDIQRKYKLPSHSEFVKSHIKPLLNPTQ